MTRAERIAERLRKLHKHVSLDYTCNACVGDVADFIEFGHHFDDLLGPEVTAGVLEGFPEAIRQAWWRAFEELQCAREATHSPTCVDIHVANAMKHRRLARWLRQLERSAQRG